MLNNRLKNFNIILASGSPRRQQFFKELGLDFEIRLKPVKEEYPHRLRHFEISDYLAQLKSLPFKEELKENDILITSDTIVWHNESALGKPRSHEEAFQMIASMSDQTHEVITSVCFTTKNTQKTVNAITKVTFKALSKDEINYYIDTYEPYDKAGAYGIQEWIGQIGITKIEGSYTNVVGLPTHLVYKTLNSMVD
ncbi:Maf-like protein [Psychroserpens sp.]|uniref:Maf-like protein n=1 Tax=Psychroserpens sp. TaxID=2020870 RepID=UPI001B1B629F|nr:Maf-like protein [Psychroserpens sp.]MBO6607534.1 septum formation protein Maf [Psychroserpens sp.]MBO6631068.1 septum formation protein Maf [Psychroserpens sp.]MBO6655194.1 septum formation protein Maf [Psychroserpens sp.]MBO6683216.1 septum formation protein Maf [Psychroserpens sp.]MBO6749780.1 septum formation protein Maf [Psychroserpens sp.]